MFQGRAYDDEGAVLVLTLAFLMLFGLFVAALLGLVGSNLSTTQVIRTRDAKNLDADAGIDYGIMRLQQDATVCPDPSAGEQTITPTVKVNSTAAITVKCTGLSGSSTGVSGYAAVLRRSSSSPLDTTNGGDKLIEGGLWAGSGLVLGKPLNVTDGDVDVASSGSCPAQPGNLSVSPRPPYGYQCVAVTPPDPPHDLPARPAAAPAPINIGGSCRVFRPGVYTSAPVLANKNYFASGVYVFKGIGNWDTNKKDIYGGAQRPAGPGDPGEGVEVVGGAPCATDADAGASANGTGVVWVFEGNSTIDVGNQGLLELFARRPATPEAARRASPCLPFRQARRGTRPGRPATPC